MTGFDIQGFNEDGRAFWSVGAATWTEVLAYLATAESSFDLATVAVLVRRGPQIHDPTNHCCVIQPYRLAAAECQDCRGDVTGVPDPDAISELVERSSLGSPDARAARDSQSDTRPEYSAVTVMFDVLAALGRAGIEVPEPRTVLRHNAITAAADILRALGVKPTTQEPAVPSVEEPT